jgi:hypothetical protein
MPCRTPDLGKRKPMRRSPAPSSPRHTRAYIPHKYFPIETGNRSHGFDAQGEGTPVGLHANPGYEPIERSAGTASSSDLKRDDRRIAGRRELTADPKPAATS